jgi:hypothetical protein
VGRASALAGGATHLLAFLCPPPQAALASGKSVAECIQAIEAAGSSDAATGSGSSSSSSSA